MKTTQSNLIKKRVNYSLLPNISFLLKQFSISENLIKPNFFYYYSKTELEWFFYDIKQSYKEQISKLHPDRENGDLNKASILNANFAELEKKFNERFNPPSFQAPPWFQVDDKGNDYISNKPNSRRCKICLKNFHPNSTWKKICSDECKKIAYKNKKKKSNAKRGELRRLNRLNKLKLQNT